MPLFSREPRGQNGSTEVHELDSSRTVSQFTKLRIVQGALASLLAFVLSFAAHPQPVGAQDQPGPSQARPAPQYTQQTPEELQSGVVYQKDLGKKTGVLGRSMQEYNPDSTWSGAGRER